MKQHSLIVTIKNAWFYLKWLLISLQILTYPVYAGVPISQFPLITSGGAADNLVLVPSVEWPTINSMANLGNYSTTTAYAGYFDEDKCYQYYYSNVEAERYFYPVRVTSNRTCNFNNKEWSGNYLNWAATQTIDAFRSALTGGYRVKDTTTETWLEKARQDGQGGAGLYPDRRLPNSGSNNTLVESLTPFSTAKNSLSQTVDITSIKTVISGLGNKMQFTFNDVSSTTNTTAYNPSTSPLLTTTKYEVSIRVKVCDPAFPETNCQAYGSNYKPEGAIQEYANRLRYSAFGYLNISDIARDGAALRAHQKSVGPYLANLTNDEVKVDNPEKEWDATTGILFQNPSPGDATATNNTFGLGGTSNAKIVNSGVINYINKFGQMTTQNHKSYDPVSEMFYAGLRYLRNKGNVPAYTDMTGATASNKYIYADGFPVLTQWDDPYQAACQAGAFLGIGDVNSHRDKNLPGNSTYRTDEPSMPSQISSDDINVIALTNKVGALEGLGNIGSTNDFSGRNNSAYIAGLAWYANTYDLRADWAGKQTAATFWVDVLEGQVLTAMAKNQYALAAKYGGFRVPENFDPLTQTTALPVGWWHTNTETLTPNSGSQFLRPDNYFTAGQSSQIINSIKQVFARIVARVNGSGAGLASNSTKLVTGTKVFQAVFFNKSWHGELKAYSVNSQTGQLYPQPDWQATEQLPTWSSRKIYTGNTAFVWSNLTSDQKTALISESLVNYLRGDPSNEQRNSGTFRDRFITPLGDIVHSQPVLVGKPDAKLYAGKLFTGANTYALFANSLATRKAVLYVGANDGMLHGFDATTGKEIYAFIPNTVIQDGLKDLADPNYSHRYYVNGELTVADVYINNAWKTVLIATLGYGGKGVFALDVTDPDNVKFLWEKNSTAIPALGNNLGKPIIVQTADGVWKAMMGNGPNGGGDKAQLVLIDIASGNSTIVDTGVGSNNGLAAVTAWSTYANGLSDIIYAGDINGNMWKFVLGDTPVKLFSAKSVDSTTNATKAQPITTAPLVGVDPLSGDRWLFFGTGQYLSQTDMTDTSQQSWYGLKLNASNTLIKLSDLVKRSILVETQVDGEYAVRVSDIGTVAELQSKSGWYFNLPANGERMVVSNVFQGDALIGTVRIPDASDICKPTGRGFVVALNPFTGGRLDRVFFDVNGDGLFDEKDNISVNGTSTIVSGVGFDSSPNTPLFIGNVMQVVQDNGTISSILTQGLPASAGRTSWHEIINF